jgi:hypothetical protein
MRAAVRYLAAFAVFVIGCSAGTRVERVYGANLVAGHYVEPEAYSWFMRASMAEAAGDSQAAAFAYRRVETIDPLADEARAKGSGLAGGRSDCRDAPSLSGPNRALALGERQMRTARSFIVCRTASGLDDLAAWAEGHGDASLRDMALQALAAVAPERRTPIVLLAQKLAGRGETASARALAAAAADASQEPWPAAWRLAAGLAVDEAIYHDDPELATARAARVSMPIEEAAARALLTGHRFVAETLASEAARAKPDAFEPQALLAMDDQRHLLGALIATKTPETPLSAATWVAIGQALSHIESFQSARAGLAGLRHGAAVWGDDVVEGALVELALRGLVGEEPLSPNVRIELRALEPPDGPSVERTVTPSALDLRHQCLALAAEEPKSARECADRLSASAPGDAVVAICHALVDAGRRGPNESQAARALLDHDPGNVLLAAAAFSLAGRADDAAEQRRARAVFAWIGSASAKAPAVAPALSTRR